MQEEVLRRTSPAIFLKALFTRRRTATSRISGWTKRKIPLVQLPALYRAQNFLAALALSTVKLTVRICVLFINPQGLLGARACLVAQFL